MPIARVQELTEQCYAGGNQWEAGFRKVPANASLQGIWADLSSAPGTPKPNYYVGAELTSTVLSGANGIWHGGNVSPKTKHLHKVMVIATGAGVTPAVFMLCDYLLFYPLVDMDSTDEQALVNSVPLPRYSDGVGVRAMLISTNPYVGGAQFTIKYTDHLGVSGKQSARHTSNTATFIGTSVSSGLVAGSFGPFLNVSGNGIRSVESVTFYGSNGGLAALVLVKPLATFMTNEVSASAEWDFVSMKPTLPRIYDGAYLGLMASPNGSVAASPITGLVSVIWN